MRNNIYGSASTVPTDPVSSCGASVPNPGDSGVQTIECDMSRHRYRVTDTRVCLFKLIGEAVIFNRELNIR